MTIINSTETSAHNIILADAGITNKKTIAVKTLYCIMHQTTKLFYILPKSLHRNTNTAQALDSTEKEKIAAEPMGAANIFCFSCETNILHIISRFYVGIWVLINTGLLFFILSTSTFAAASAADNTGAILVTIKPLYSLVAHLTEGIETPVLLMKQRQSPHHYNMRPSERRLLSKARIIIWLGPQMESFLSKIIQQHKSSAIAVSVMQAKNLKLLGKRKKNSHNEDHSSSSFKPEHHTIDPHIWLSADNAIAISRHIAASLIANHPKNSGLYKKNLQQLVNKINHTKDFIKSTLTNRSQPYIVFHDAFQYFENEYELNYIDSIRYDEETGSSLKHIRQVKARIDKDNIQCLVYQAPKPAIVDSLTKQTSIKAFALDPLGLNINNDKNAWFELMQNLAVDFDFCLKP